MKYEDLSGKVALVTGGSYGIGRETVLSYAKNGSKLAIADIDEDAAQTLAYEVNRLGGEAIAIKTDVTNPEDIQSMLKSVVTHYGCVDIAFNNAGIDLEHSYFDKIDEDTFNSIMKVNVKGVYLGMKYEIAQMLKQGKGVIINTASIGGLTGSPRMAIYGASKHAVVGLTKSAAIEYAPKGIRINSICPGVINTDMTHRALGNDLKNKERVIKMHPIGRLGEAKEVSSAVMFLSSDASSFILGHQLVIDGGATA